MSNRAAKHDKQGKQGRSAANLPPLALLGPRLNRLWSDPAWPSRSHADLQADLDTVSKGITAPKLVSALLKAYQDAPAPAQTQLNQIVPPWLRDRGHLPALREAVVRNTLAGPDLELAVAWLQVAGEDTAALTQLQQPDTFFDAYFYRDRSQATLLIFWYRDNRRTRAQGMNFLLDYNPPWDGAVKDIMAFPREDPRAALRKYAQSWTAKGIPVTQIGAVEAKGLVLKALLCNRKNDIRLPADLIADRDSFVRYVLSLPDGPDTPSFTEGDFDALIHVGQRPEEIMHFEQTVGRRVRMEDGQEVMILGGGLDDGWEDEEWDDEDELANGGVAQQARKPKRSRRTAAPQVSVAQALKSRLLGK